MNNYKKEHGDVSFEIKWKPFRLNPDLPQDDPGKCACAGHAVAFRHRTSCDIAS